MYLDLWNSRDGSNASSDHSCVFDLTQNPSFIAVMSKNGSLPTMRRNSKFWLPAKRRFIVPWGLPRDCRLSRGQMSGGLQVRHSGQCNVFASNWSSFVGHVEFCKNAVSVRGGSWGFVVRGGSWGLRAEIPGRVRTEVRANPFVKGSWWLLPLT